MATTGAAVINSYLVIDPPVPPEPPAVAVNDIDWQLAVAVGTVATAKVYTWVTAVGVPEHPAAAK